MRFFRRPRFCPIFTASMRDDAERREGTSIYPCRQHKFPFLVVAAREFFLRPPHNRRSSIAISGNAYYLRMQLLPAIEPHHVCLRLQRYYRTGKPYE